MQRAFRLCVVVSLVLTAGGCIVIDRGDGARAPSPVIKSMTQKEIDAAAKLMFENERQSALADIAARPNLDPYDQSYLARAIFEKITFDNNRVALLQTLIANPSFSNAAKSTILERLDRGLMFDNHRRQILKQLNDRGPLEM
jgi:hypothetical protein